MNKSLYIHGVFCSLFNGCIFDHFCLLYSVIRWLCSIIHMNKTLYIHQVSKLAEIDLLFANFPKLNLAKLKTK